MMDHTQKNDGRNNGTANQAPDGCHHFASIGYMEELATHAEAMVAHGREESGKSLPLLAEQSQQMFGLCIRCEGHGGLPQRAEVTWHMGRGSEKAQRLEMQAFLKMRDSAKMLAFLED